jgi:hypothetical protein
VLAVFQFVDVEDVVADVVAFLESALVGGLLSLPRVGFRLLGRALLGVFALAVEVAVLRVSVLGGLRAEARARQLLVGLADLDLAAVVRKRDMEALVEEELEDLGEEAGTA